LLLTYPGQLGYGLYLLSEQLFMTCLVLHCAAAVLVFERPTPARLVALAGTAVIAVSVRPAGYFLYASIIAIFLLWHGSRQVIAKWALGPLVALTLALGGGSSLLRGEATQSITGLALFPHVAHLYVGGPDDLPPEQAAAVRRTVEPFAFERASKTSLIER